MTYAEIVALVNSAGTIAQKRAAFEEREAPAQAPTPPLWSRPNYFCRVDSTVDDFEMSSVVFAKFSWILRLNCDVRDVGILVMGRTDMRLTDGVWSTDREIAADRLTPKVQPYTLDSIASLNYTSCGSWALGAWIRAFGVGCGILPASDTRLIKEWKYTRSVAREAHLLIHGVHEKVGSMLLVLCLNLLAMFGLLHLNKNHTFKTGDANLARICTSYIQTLCTMVNATIIDDIKAHMEVACKTAAHPFGLGQTYWVARTLGVMRALATPLAFKLDVSPPLVHKLMIVDTAVKEWQNLPIGMVLNQLFEMPLLSIRSEIATVKANPPSYSKLWEYYACPSFSQVRQEAKDAVDTLMPIVCGFAEALHVDDLQKRDGLALAISYLNVERDAKTAIRTYTHLWTQYLEDRDSSGLERFI